MDKRIALLVAGFIFGIISIVHLIRLYYQFVITVDGVGIPMWVSGVGFVVTLGLAIWMFVASR